MIKNLAEIKGCFLACAMICNIPVDVGTLIQDDVSLMLKVERCISCNFEVLLGMLLGRFSSYGFLQHFCAS